MKEIVVPGIYEKVAVSDEYYEVQKRELYRLRQEKRRSLECHAPSYRNCFGDCDQCKFFCPERMDSIEEMSERLADEGGEIENELLAVDTVHEIQLHVRERVKALGTEDRKICKCIMAGMSERQAAKAMGLPNMTYHDRKTKLLKRLAEDWADLRDLLQ